MFTIVNSQILERIKVLLNHYELSVSAFADRIGIQRSTMSHILNGRNRPSLDFIMKVTQTYPEINLYWLIHGEGSLMRKLEGAGESPTLPFPANETSEEVSEKLKSTEPSSLNNEKGLSKIVFFHQDGTFEIFHQKS